MKNLHLLLAVAAFFTVGLRAEAEAPTEKPAAQHEAAAGSEPAVATEAAPKKAPKTRISSEDCLADPVAFADIRARREELDRKDQDLTARESELNARQTALDDEIKRLEDLRTQIAKLEETQSTANEEKVARVVQTLESMSPKNAAVVLAQVDEAVAVTAMMRITPQKLGKIMNQMEPVRASKLTELMAGVSRAKRGASFPSSNTSNDVAANNVGKGGEKKP